MPKLTIEIAVSNEEEARALEVFVKAAPGVRGRMLFSVVAGMTQDDLWNGMQKWKVNWAVFARTGGLSRRAFDDLWEVSMKNKAEAMWQEWVKDYNADPDPTGMCSCCHKEGPHQIVTLFLGTYRIDLTLCETCMTRTDIVVGATPEDRLTGADAKGLPTDSFLEYLLSRKYQTFDLFLTPPHKKTPMTIFDEASDISYKVTNDMMNWRHYGKTNPWQPKKCTYKLQMHPGYFLGHFEVDLWFILAKLHGFEN